MDFLMTSPEYFRTIFEDARSTTPLIADATSEFSDDGATRYYLSEDQCSGFAVRGSAGELVFVFSLVKGRGNDIVDAAKQAGATHLDCFRGHLTKLYARHGFLECWSEPNWTPGGPDVVYMALAGSVSDPFN